MTRSDHTSDDRQVIETQIGRPLRADSTPVSRCHLGLPVVVRVPPFLDDGTPFPTLYWLTCPLAVGRIARLEGSGGIRRLEQKAEADAGFGLALAEAGAAYQAERDALVPPGRHRRHQGASEEPGPGSSASTRTMPIPGPVVRTLWDTWCRTGSSPWTA